VKLVPLEGHRDHKVQLDRMDLMVMTGMMAPLVQMVLPGMTVQMVQMGFRALQGWTVRTV
jgi:hypothetical protein